MQITVFQYMQLRNEQGKCPTINFWYEGNFIQKKQLKRCDKQVKKLINAKKMDSYNLLFEVIINRKET